MDTSFQHGNPLASLRNIKMHMFNHASFFYAMSFQYGTNYLGVELTGDEILRPDTGYELIDSGRGRSAGLEGEPQ